jgi:hypothetical protein
MSSRPKRKRKLREGARSDYERAVLRLRWEARQRYLGLGALWTGVMANDQLRMWKLLREPAA